METRPSSNRPRKRIFPRDWKSKSVSAECGNTVSRSLAEANGISLERALIFIHSSLVALSLIMSLLQFKPAPMYILDEIDAALDLDHTQNIGQLFKNRFKGSQFIVVSLKEGMFTNANVLFRAKFRDGISAVDVRCISFNSCPSESCKSPQRRRVG